MGQCPCCVCQWRTCSRRPSALLHVVAIVKVFACAPAGPVVCVLGADAQVLTHVADKVSVCAWAPADSISPPIVVAADAQELLPVAADAGVQAFVPAGHHLWIHTNFTKSVWETLSSIGPYCLAARLGRGRNNSSPCLLRDRRKRRRLGVACCPPSCLCVFKGLDDDGDVGVEVDVDVDVDMMLMMRTMIMQTI